MLTCDQARPLLSAHLDHELPAADAAQVGAHVISCVACGREFDDLKKVGRAVRDLPLRPLPAGFMSRLEQRRRAPALSAVRLSARLSPRPAAFAAAALLVALVIAGPWRSQRLARAPGEALTANEPPSLKIRSEPPPPETPGGRDGAPAAAVAPLPPSRDMSGGQPFGESPGLTNEQLQQGLKEESDRLGIVPYKEPPPANEPFLGRRLGTREGRARAEAVVESFAAMRRAVDEGAGKRSVAVEGSVAPVLGGAAGAGRASGRSLGAPVEDGFWSGDFAAGNEGYRTITSPEEWNQVWRSLSTSPVPPVDFTKVQLLAIFLGPRPTGGYSVEFVEVKNAASKLIVRWREHTPPPGITPPERATAPYAIKAVPRSDLPVRFEKTR